MLQGFIFRFRWSPLTSVADRGVPQPQAPTDLEIFNPLPAALLSHAM